METSKNCPRCKEGKLIEVAVREEEMDIGDSILWGAATGTGLFPMTREVDYIEYTCSKNCGYQEKKEKQI